MTATPPRGALVTDGHRCGLVTVSTHAGFAVRWGSMRQEVVTEHLAGDPGVWVVGEMEPGEGARP